jgi:hypothetical protein
MPHAGAAPAVVRRGGKGGIGALRRNPCSFRRYTLPSILAAETQFEVVNL